MIDALWSDDKIDSALDSITERLIPYDAAYAAMSTMQGQYEADRATSAQTIGDLNANIVVLGNTIVTDDAAIQEWRDENTALSTTVNSLSAQVTTLTQDKATLTSNVATLNGTVTYLQSALNASTGTVTSLQGQVVTLTQSNASLSATNTSLSAQVATLTPDVTVTVGTSGIISRTVPAVSYVEQTPLWTTAAWPTAKANIAACVGAHKIHIFPFGLLDPQTTATSPIDLTTPQRLATALAKIREVSATAPIILTLYGASWWMKQTLYNGAIADLTSASAYLDSGRVKYSQLAKWLALVDASVTLAAASGCRDFEVWNELKGYYDVYPHVGQTWDASMNPGNTTAHPVMGYSYFYQQSVAQVIATMTRLGYPRTAYRIGGPYMLLNSQGVSDSDSIPSTHPLYPCRTVWGYLDKEGDNALKQFLGNVQANSLPLDVLCIDATTWNTDEQYPTANPFDLTRKYGDITSYIRTLLPTYGLPADLPIRFSECYVVPQPTLRTIDSSALLAAMTADMLAQCLLNRVEYAILWGPTAAGTGGVGGGNAGIVASDGTLQKAGAAVKLFRDHFAPGANVYPLQSSDPSVDGVGFDGGAILWSKTPNIHKVALDGDVYTLAPYEVRGVALG